MIEPNDLFGVPTGAFSKILRKCVLAGVESWDQVGEIAGQIVGRALEMVGSQLDMFHVQLLKGKATFVDEHTVKFMPTEGEPRKLHTDAVFIGTGSHAFRPPGIDFDIPEVFGSDTISIAPAMSTSLVEKQTEGNAVLKEERKAEVHRRLKPKPKGGGRGGADDHG